ncbi:hypothetical protein AMTR_s00015p00252740 [Amborella trichopoda]|uniref:Uncharacterized protein n=1 Tax=Amborella trichopoda TaxID=13333 RepID=W1PMB4_AMBTC|nr:hypothetical protein AMTR_s00015p00252740 [Amborella trichopoda]
MHGHQIGCTRFQSLDLPPQVKEDAILELLDPRANHTATVASLKPDSEGRRAEEMIVERGRTFRAGPQVQTSKFSLEVANERSKGQSSPTLNSILEGMAEEPLRLSPRKPSTSPTISTFDTDAPQVRVEEKWVSSLERLAKGSPIEEPPLFAPTSFSETMMDQANKRKEDVQT